MVTNGNDRSGFPYFTMALFDYAYFPLTFTYLKLNTMTAIPGVTITRNAKGKPTHINIDLRKHQEVIPVLKEMGLLPETEADIDVEDTVTLDEFNSELESAIHNHYANTR